MVGIAVCLLHLLLNSSTARTIQQIEITKVEQFYLIGTMPLQSTINQHDQSTMNVNPVDLS
jgi:hypothetical protein